MERNNPKSLAMLITSMVIFGTIGIFRRYLPISSTLIAFFRGIIGSLFLLAFMGKHSRRGKTRTTLDHGLVIKLILTGIAIGINWILLFEAYNYTTVSVATLCYYMEPTFVILLATVVFREKMTARKAICAVVALLGMVLISGVSSNGIGPVVEVEGIFVERFLSLMQSNHVRGILLGLGAGVLYAGVVLTNKTIHDVDPYQKTVLQLASASLVLLPYIMLTGGFKGVAWSAGVVVLLLFVGIVHTGIAYALYFGSMDGLKTQTVALFSYIDPVTALILSAVILGEKMTLMGIVGAVLILGSALYCELEKN